MEINLKTVMPEHILKPETQTKDDIPSLSPGDFLQALESVGSPRLPVGTEVSPVPPESRVVVYNDPKSAGADRFRLAKIRLKSIQTAKKLKSLLITSPLPGDGKSTIALNLATVLCEEGKVPVLLFEGDVHRPTLVKRLGLKAWPGLTECYERGDDPMLAIQRIDPLGFYLLPAGQPLEDSVSFLQSNYTAQVFKGPLSSSFSWIVIDGPPTTPVADILALKAQADGTLLVARAGVTPREAIEESTRNLGRDHIVGIILNNVEGLHRTYSKYYGYGTYGARVKPSKPKVIDSLELNKYGR
jgi:Mrp family chromosome partitioning ATPase